MSTAIVHDYLNQPGGAERVVLELSRIWPEASIYTSIYRPESTFPDFKALDVKTSPLQRLPVDESFRSLLPLYPAAFRALGTLGEDLVISSSSGWAHAVRTRPDALHVVYCHTPARWLYGREYMEGSRADAALGATPLHGHSARQSLIRPLTPWLRAWDRKAAARADLYIANSRATQERVAKVYGREAVVVHPPVDTERFRPTQRGERLLVICRLLPYKRVDLAVTAAKRAGIGLDVVGTGPAFGELTRMAGPTVTFHGRLGDEEITELIQNASAVCVPGAEDFGIVPVEAQAAGKPVVAFAAGGALETVREGVSGALFDEATTEGLLDAVRRCEQLQSTPEQIAEQAQRFSVAAFRRGLLAAVEGARGERENL